MTHIEPMYEIVGESGSADGEGCLRDIAAVSVALGLLVTVAVVLTVGGLAWLTL